MKSFRKYIQEAYESQSSDVTGRVDVSDLHQFSSDKGILSKLNTWIGDIADREHITVQAALEQLYRKVEQVGIEFDTIIDEDVSDSGSMDLPITQYGGRMGKDEEGNDLDDDFISSKGPELKMHVEYERMPNKMFKVVADIR
jgi:hypothetical protein|tara:strand:+ start:2968 stop:3393 length:426 start_codon:yes stop_codon:yes gene_type:complete